MTRYRFWFAIATLLVAVPEVSEGRQDSTITRTRDSLQQGQGFGILGSAPFPVTPIERSDGPRPPGSRYVFDRDSMLWNSAITVADLLRNIPGVFVARPGFLGQPEYVMYFGRGPASVEVFWDGMRHVPMSADSAYVDLGRVSLAYLARVEVEVLPQSLRVFIVSERYQRPEPRSSIRVMSGGFSSAQYSGLFQKRWPSGLGVNVAGDFVGSDGSPERTSSDQYLDLWGKLEWVPRTGLGIAYQIRRQNFDRKALDAESGPGIPSRDGHRTESLLRMFVGQETGKGWSGDLGIGASAWSDSVLGSQNVRQAFARVQYDLPNLNASISWRAADARVDHEVEAAASWIPKNGIVMAGRAGRTWYASGDNGLFAHASLGLYWGPFSVVGDIGTTEMMQAPAFTDDTLQTTSAMGVRLGFETARVTGHIGMRDFQAFQPLSPPDIGTISRFLVSPATTYLVADASVKVFDPFTLSGSFVDPQQGFGSDLQPPRHGKVAATFRSKFWRTFRSGIYDFMVQYSLESWSAGFGGLDGSGQSAILPGATFQEVYVQIQLVDFRVFWNLRNSGNVLAGYVPGFLYPRNAQTFGVRWEFFN